MKIREKTKILFTSITEMKEEELEKKIKECFDSLDPNQVQALKNDYKTMIKQSRKRFQI